MVTPAAWVTRLRLWSSAARWRMKPGRGMRSGRLDWRYDNVFSIVQRYLSMKYTAQQKQARDAPSMECTNTLSAASMVVSMKV